VWGLQSWDLQDQGCLSAPLCPSCSPAMFHSQLHSFSRPPLTLANFSFVNLVFIFRRSSSTTDPVRVRRVNLLVCSLPLHRHSYIGFTGEDLGWVLHVTRRQCIWHTRACPVESTPGAYWSAALHVCSWLFDRIFRCCRKQTGSTESGGSIIKTD
jgi:hypothetical protein